MTPETGQLFGPYRLIKKLGAGGMGMVWRAVDTRLERDVALKFLLPSEAEDPVAMARFRRESVAVTRLNHPNILTVFEAGVLENSPYLCSELVDGKALSDMITRNKGLPPAEVLDYGLQLVCALRAAHSLGIVHRDIKPLNVMVRPDGVLKLLDFGIARREEDPAISQPGKLVGTPRYMAPERLQGKEMDPRSDLFSVGAMLYEMYCGRPAFEGVRIPAVIQSILNDEPKSLKPANQLTEVISRSLQKDPASRFASADAMHKALKACSARRTPLSGKTKDSTTIDLAPDTVLQSVVAPPVSGPESLAELAEGIHLETNSKLGLSRAVKLISPLAYRGKPEISLSEAEDLGADYLLESKVRGTHQRLRLYLSFIKVQGGEQVWSETLETAGESSFDLEDACVTWLLGMVNEYFRSQPNEGEQANQEDSLADALANYRSGDLASLTSTRSQLESILARHPDFGLAHGRLASVLVDSLRFERTSRQILLARAHEHADRSVALSPDQPFGYLAKSKACVSAGQADWSGALQYLAQAFKADPGDLEVNSWRALFDAQTGQPDRAVQRARALLRHDPESVEMLTALSVGSLCQGEFHTALESAEKILRLRRCDSFGMCLVFYADVCLGSTERALRFASFLRRQNDQTREQGGFDPILESLLFIADALDDPETARKRGVREDLFKTRASARLALTAYGILKDHKSAEIAMEQMLKAGFRNAPYVKSDPHLTGFHDQGWFIEGLASIEAGAP